MPKTSAIHRVVSIQHRKNGRTPTHDDSMHRDSISSRGKNILLKFYPTNSNFFPVAKCYNKYIETKRQILHVGYFRNDNI